MGVMPADDSATAALAAHPVTGKSLTEADLEPFRKQLTGYCYRMLGSGSEAEDAVQDTMIKAWRNLDRFEGRASLKSWLYRIATNVCLDMLQGPQRRARPMDLGPASTADTLVGVPLTEATWVQPIPDALVVSGDGDPAEVAAERESIRLAFIATLQHLPARQRAVLILREVLRWQASEVAELLGTSVASVNSALQRARATLDGVDPDALSAGASKPGAVDSGREDLLASFMSAFESYDIDGIVALLRDDVEFSMPPFQLWLQSPAEVAKFLVGQGIECKGSRLLPVQANGQSGFACYHPAKDGDGYAPWCIQLFDVEDGKITGWHNYLSLDPKIFPLFGLPDRLAA
jgi:RNA polymerase sigma-70 factor (ECF subfamily)